MKKVAVIQSNYIPWKGYFDIIHDVDLFIFYDDVQYTKNDWRNRNIVKTSTGTRWLTIPIGASLNRLICEVRLQETSWKQNHWRSIEQYYGNAPHYHRYRELLQSIYFDMQWDTLSAMNQFIIKKIAQDILGIQTEIQDSRQYGAQGVKFERLLDLLKKAGAEMYVSGPAARNYLDEKRFNEENITLIYKDYAGYPEYLQSYPPFEHAVTILDLLFHCGDDSPYYIWGWREGRGDVKAEPGNAKGMQ